MYPYCRSSDPSQPILSATSAATITAIQSARETSDELPYFTALTPWTRHSLAWLAIECLGKGRHIRWGSDGTEPVKRVRVQIDLHPFIFGAVIRCPDLRVSNEEALLGREPLYVRGPRFALQRSEERRVGKECRSRW